MNKQFLKINESNKMKIKELQNQINKHSKNNQFYQLLNRPKKKN